GVVEPAGGDDLVGVVGYVSPAESRECGRRNVKKFELAGDVDPDIPHVAMTYLEDLQIKHYFRTRTIQLSEKLGCGFQRCLRSAQRNCARCGIEAGELELKQRPQRVHQFVQLLGGTAPRDIKR